MAEHTKALINRVANSSLVVINLEDYYPKKEIVLMDLKEHLFKELLLKEKDFRAALKDKDWSVYEDKIVLVHVSNDAIIPVWAYMLVGSYLTGIAAEIFQGDMSTYLSHHFENQLSEMDLSIHQDARIVIKGCSNKPVPPSAYAGLTSKLKPYAQSIMYGEPCSTVPIYKRPRKL